MLLQHRIKKHVSKYSTPKHILWSIIAPVRYSVIVAQVISGGAAIATLASLICLAWTLYQVHCNQTIYPIVPLAYCSVFIITACILRLVSFNISHNAAFRLEALLRISLAQKIMAISLWKVHKLGTAMLANSMQDDVKSLHIFVADSTPLYVRAIITPLLTFLLAFYLDWRLSFAALLIVIGAGAIIICAGRSTISQRYNQARESISHAIIDYMQAMPVVRLFDGGSSSFVHYQRALKRWLEVLTQWYQQAGFSARLSFVLLNPLTTLLVLIWFQCALSLQNSAHISAWIILLLIASGMAEAIMPMMSLHHMVLRTRISAARLHQLLMLEEQPQPLHSLQPHVASVTFDHVHFNYGSSHSSASTLTDINFHAPAGSITALVGPSGAGKSTVIRLLYRFADVSVGTIRIGDVDIRQMSTNTLMQHIAYVSQETFLFSDTVANNIRAGMPTAGMDTIVAAAKAAQADAFIQTLPDGYDTKVSERGSSLSGGQRQRIAIARALVQNRPIIILDEVTAFLDSNNEAAILTSLLNTAQGKTVFLVTHKPSVAACADHVLFLSAGTLVAQGTHAQLLASLPDYAALWARPSTACDEFGR